MSSLLEPPRSGIVFVECIRCPASSRIRVDVLDDVSDDEAETWFNAQGWSVRPTLCPVCRALAGAAT